jgi:Flp pilus assembly protein TadD
MRRAPLKAALSALVLCAAGCAGTGTPAPQKSAAPPPKPDASAAASSGTKAATDLPPATSVEEQLQKAQGLRTQGKLGEATHILAQLVLAAPDDPRVLGEYGKTLVQLNRSDDAVAFLKRATELKPADWSLYSALGVAYDQMDDRKHAKTAYERALALHPGDMAVLNNYAVSRMLAGDLETAQRLLLQAQTADPTNAKVQGNLLRLAQMKAGRSASAPVKSAADVAGAPKPISPSVTSTAAASPPRETQPSSVADTQKPAAHKPAAKLSKTTPPKTTLASKTASANKAASANSAPANKTASATKTASSKMAAKKPAPPPALRTADQNE